MNGKIEVKIYTTTEGVVYAGWVDPDFYKYPFVKMYNEGFPCTVFPITEIENIVTKEVCND